MTEQSVAAVLTRAQRELAQLENPRFEASILLCHHLQWPDSKLISHSDQMLSPDQTQGFSALVQRRASGEPSAYITGERAFWTLELQVTPDTLIPRPDTEILVEQCLLLLQGKASPRVLDMGTGSGAIALAIASERTDAIVEATDISPSALAVAQNNAQLNGLNLHAWHQGSWFEALPTGASGYDLIVSNPPYIANNDPHLPALAHEPLLALTSGTDGLDDIRRLVKSAPEYLTQDGYLALEHGYDQAQAVAELLSTHGYSQIQQQRDLGQIVRASAARRPEL